MLIVFMCLPFLALSGTVPRAEVVHLEVLERQTNTKHPRSAVQWLKKMHFARVDVADEGSYDHLQESEKPRDVVFVFFISFLPPLH